MAFADSRTNERIKMSDLKKVDNFMYANGVNISQTKKICVFAFGDYFHSIKKNKKERRFDIYLTKSIGKVDISEACDLEYFTKFWGRAFHLIVMSVEELGKVDTVEHTGDEL